MKNNQFVRIPGDGSFDRFLSAVANERGKADRLWPASHAWYGRNNIEDAYRCPNPTHDDFAVHDS
jgi:hypothetical protein